MSEKKPAELESTSRMPAAYKAAGYQPAPQYILWAMAIAISGNLLYAQSPPSIVSLSPNSGTGPAQTFTTTISDPNGATNTSEVYFYIGNGWTAPYCFSYYQGQSNLLYLWNDATNSWLGGFAPSGSGSASNSLCSLSGPGSSVSKVGNTLTLNLAFTFQSAFSGTRNISINAFDVNGSGSGYQVMGSWNVTGCTQASFLGGSTNPSTVAPGGAFQVSCNYGYGNYGYVYGNNCDSFAGYSGTTATFNCTAPSTPGSYAQSCDLGTGPPPYFCARQNDPAGTLTVTAAPSDPPTITSVTPSFGNGLTQTFTAVMSDVNGAVNIGYVLFYVGPSFASLPAPYCEVDYEAQSNTLRVGSDVDGWSSPVTPSGTGTASSTRCSLSASGSSVNVSGNVMTLNLALTFQTSMAGTQKLSVNAFHYITSQSSGWQDKGTWTVPASGVISLKKEYIRLGGRVIAVEF